MDWVQRICFPVWVCLKLSPVTCPESYSFPTALSGRLSDTTGDTALRIKTMAQGLQIEWKTHHTVDGRNPAPVDMEKLPLFTGFYTSQVVKDFFHQNTIAEEKNLYISHIATMSIEVRNKVREGTSRSSCPQEAPTPLSSE